jgi:dihydrodipicolinate synthase/N-acetylneuraminate lyase
VSLQRETCGKDFIQLSGEDATALGFNAHGGVGCISVTANVAPRLCAEFQEATLAGDYARALDYQDRLMPLHTAIFLEPGLAGAKYACRASAAARRGAPAAAAGHRKRPPRHRRGNGACGAGAFFARLAAHRSDAQA